MSGADGLLPELEALAARPGVSILPLAHGANVRGALELGALSEVLPGPRPAAAGAPDLARLRDGRAPKVLYLVGEAPFATRPDCELVIAQDLYLPPFEVDAFLPAASFVEAEGTLTSIEGRVQELRRVEHLPAGAVHGRALPDWQIFSDLAGRLGRDDLRYTDDAAVRSAIRAEVPGFAAEGDRRPRAMAPIGPRAGSPPGCAVGRRGGGWRAARRRPALPPGRTTGRATGSPGRGRFVLVTEHASLRHRGIDLATVVEGLGELHLEEGVAMNPDDLARLGVEPGGVVTVGLDGSDLVRAAQPDPDCPRGAAYLVRDEPWEGRSRPLRVSIRAGDRSRATRPARRAPVAAADRGPARKEAAMVTIVERRMIVPNVHVLTVEAPEVAESARPGNFVILRPDEQGERIPLTIADWDAAAGTVTSIFVQVGASTAKLARLQGRRHHPLVRRSAGQQDRDRAVQGTVLLIGGCYGLGSLYPIARALKAAGNEVYALIEARSWYLLYWQERLETVVDRLIVVTRDGSRGYKGHVPRAWPRSSRSRRSPPTASSPTAAPSR